MERKAGAPHAIKEWFFPDHRYGHEFVYPETGALEITEADESAVKPVESGELQSNATSSTKNDPDEESDYLRLLHQKQAEPLELAKTDEHVSMNKSAEAPEVDYLELVRRKQIEVLGRKPAQTAMLRELPRTGSSLPLVALLGVLSLAASVGLRLYFKRAD